MPKKKKQKNVREKHRKLSVVFVCTGNTCRSPIAEACMRELVRSGELEHRIAVGSAGLMAHTGSPASANSVEVCRAAGLDLTGHVSRQLTGEILNASDIVVCMQREHAQALERLEQASGRELLVLSAFSGSGDEGIPDPYGGDLAEYQRTFDRISGCMHGLLEYLKKRLELSLSKDKH